MELDEATRAELYERARELDIDGRSSMNRSELEEAVGAAQAHADSAPTTAGARFEAFARLAADRAAGEFRPTPTILTDEERRLHVRQTIREDHRHRIATDAEDAEEKFDALAESVFDFFRGTALLFYRDMAGDDSWMPTVLNLGDVHPDNFGVMPSAHNVPIFSVNDFDEAAYGPFTWDLKRGAVGFMIAGASEGGLGQKKQRKLVRKFVRGYIEGLRGFAQDADELDQQIRLDNAPELIRNMIDDEWEKRQEWLDDDYYDEFRRGFRSDEDLVPISARRDEFQEIIDRLVEQNDIDVPERAADMRVKDVAIRRHQGTASLGLERYYVLIEGPTPDENDDLVIELKRARRSALSGLVPPSEFTIGGEAARIAHAQRVQLVRGDVFFGHVDIDGRSFMSRERAPFRGDVDLDDLSWKDWKTYARICGRTLAHAHALSDEGVGSIQRDIEPEILDAIGEPDLFVDDIVRFATDATTRVRHDHELFADDQRLGAFRRVDRVYR